MGCGNSIMIVTSLAMVADLIGDDKVGCMSVSAEKFRGGAGASGLSADWERGSFSQPVIISRLDTNGRLETTIAVRKSKR